MTESMTDAAAFKQFMDHIVAVNGSIGSDMGEWGALATICSNSPDVHTYAQGCVNYLWTDGEDQTSWGIVKNGAATALNQGEHDALVTVLTSFLNITDPSHNSEQWNDLRQTAYNLLGQINKEPFHVFLISVRKLADGISTDQGEWAKYAEICNDAASAGLRRYIARCEELWTDGLDQTCWVAVKTAAQAAASLSDREALRTILLGFSKITAPAHNGEQWAVLRQQAWGILTGADYRFYLDDSSIPWTGTDTRAQRVLVNPDRLPVNMDLSYLIRRNDFPAHYTETATIKTCHVEYFMRLNQSDPTGAAYFIVTHSQDGGGYVGLARVPGDGVGTGGDDHKVLVAEPNFAGDMVWYDRLDGSHPGGCNHPGNGGQIGSKVVLVGQDWTKTYPVIGHVVTPVGNGSKILFYDFEMLGSNALPSMAVGGAMSSAYRGCITTQQLNIADGDDGEVSTVLIEQGPDGDFYMIAANRYQTVLWTSPELVPGIASWRQVPIWGWNSMEDGSAMLAWARFDGMPKPALYYVKANGSGMNFLPIRYQVEGGKVVSVLVGDSAEHQTAQNTDQFIGDGGWVNDNGSLFVGAHGGIAMHGAYQSLNDLKGPPGSETPCIQVRTWYAAGSSQGG